MTDIHDKTRAIYHSQHDRLRSDESARRRIHSMNSEQYFGLGPDWFRGKTAADIGCGNTAVLSIRLSSFGAKHVTLVDIGSAWMPSAQEEMRREKISDDRYSMR
jgi:ribosomal protein L11 methylase PrmA